ncbi:DoxX family protein [Mycolicibacterium sp. CBMA 226]|uniref:DoxX family protein n=1 Tax=Mycolicibacterium sp. CBMA 226 TaxID=2606611 RepID=UPI0012DCBF97|nr:DoxX family protein [Mycolicibacterium sp. CBMA 226]MUL75025.1 DoxX family protein [Mycolicibacterium sp. CBMA 226]
MIIRRIARPLLAIAFIGQGVETLLNTDSGADAVRPALDGLKDLPDPVARNVPSNAVAVARATAAAQVAGGLLLATGRIPRVASAVLAATVIPANLGNHMFWAEDDPEAKAAKRRGFLADLSLLGGLILASADTAGKPSLGWRGRRAAQRAAETFSSTVPSRTEVALARMPELGEKVGHGVQTGFEHGRELAGVALEKLEDGLEKAAPYAESAYRKASARASELADTAREQASELASTAVTTAKKAKARA